MTRAMASEMKLLAMAVALCGGLVACDGGRYDATTGRYIPGAVTRALDDLAGRPTLATAQPANPCHRSEDGARSALDTNPSTAYGAAGQAGDGSYAAAQPSGSQDLPSAEAALTSRNAPTPTLQADGTVVRPAIARVTPQSVSAGGGDELVIAGSGFAYGGVQVLVGNTPARVTSVSSNAVTVIVPPGLSGPTSVVVTNRDGTYAAAGNAIVYM